MKKLIFLWSLILCWPVSGFPRDAAELEALRQAAARGAAAAQFEMGILYEYGYNLPENKAPAFAWYTLAAQQGHAEAAKRRDLLRGRMAPEELEQARKLMPELVLEKPRPVPPPSQEPVAQPPSAPTLPAIAPPMDLLGPPD